MTIPTPIPSTTLMNTASAPGSVVADPAGTVMDAVNGNTWANSGMTLVRVQNTGGSPATLVLTPAETVGGLNLQSDSRVIPATSTQWIARLNPAVYGSNIVATGPASLKLTIIEP
jgi:hypothetical protein